MRAALLVVVACSAPSAPPVAPVAPVKRTVAVPISDPAEYDIDRISRDAGKAIFAKTGIGDPYRTGLPYPIFLALLRAYPTTFGATTAELAG